MEELDGKLHELLRLWVDPKPANLQRIESACLEIGRLADARRISHPIDRHLLARLATLAARAQKRLAECLLIHTQTGGYSSEGELELVPNICTEQWEG
jgi:hypothetical protein